jgi:hypothetical protein
MPPIRSGKVIGKFFPARAVVGITIIIVLFCLATVAYLTGWSGGADKILTVTLVLVGSIPLRTFFGENNKKKI